MSALSWPPWKALPACLPCCKTLEAYSPLTLYPNSSNSTTSTRYSISFALALISARTPELTLASSHPSVITTAGPHRAHPSLFPAGHAVGYPPASSPHHHHHPPFTPNTHSPATVDRPRGHSSPCPTRRPKGHRFSKQPATPQVDSSKMQRRPNRRPCC